MTSPARPPIVREPFDVPVRRSAVARPSATHTVAVTPLGASPMAFSTMARRSTPSGRVTDPAGPTVCTPASMRDNRNVRVALRSRSWPTRYHRPRAVTTPHGSTVRST